MIEGGFVVEAAAGGGEQDGEDRAREQNTFAETKGMPV